MIDAITVQRVLIEELGFNDSPGLEDFSTFSNGRSIPQINAVYNVNSNPIAYFSSLEQIDEESIWELHRSVWSQSKVPLLFVALPYEIRVYNCYTPPTGDVSERDISSSEKLLRHLTNLADVEDTRRQVKLQLQSNGYDRLSIDTGAFWTTIDGRRVRRENRADQTLLRAMNSARLSLLDTRLPNYYAYALLGRSIFIRYLEDRGILEGNWVTVQTRGRYASYVDVLSSPSDTVEIFRNLSERFNGDLFPIDENEPALLNIERLSIIAAFLQGTDLETGQLSLWPYNFDFIPIELISGIYDTFLSAKKRRELGAYYTPLSLVEVVLDATLPSEIVSSKTTILDPACGSGVFLVSAYQKLVEAWKRENDRFPTAPELANILTNSIYGVDVLEEAVYIAAFSLYLAMLDYVSLNEVRAGYVKFPVLKGFNLLHSDFFSKKVEDTFGRYKFDRVVGNLPWGRGTLKDEALEWSIQEGHEVGGRQIVQAFLTRAPYFCKGSGEVALLAPAKSTILVSSRTHESFRENFFKNYSVRAVVNLSALVYELFLDSLSPAVAFFYRMGRPSDNARIVYGVPKPSPVSQQLGAIVLDTTEVKYLELREVMANPHIWKVALWGNARDAALIERLSGYPSLQDQADKREWEIREGFIGERTGVELVEAPWLTKMPYLDVNKFRAYYFKAEETVQERLFERPRTPDVYRAPATLIHRSRIQALYLDEGSLAYRNKITGVIGRSGQEDELKLLTAYINSPIPQYYHFLTSTSWAVERGTIIHSEYKEMPFIIPAKGDERYQEIVRRVDAIVVSLRGDMPLFAQEIEQQIEEHQAAINELLFDLYEFSVQERQLVEDMLKYGIGFFQWVKQKNRLPERVDAVKRPDTTMLGDYAKAFIETMTGILKYQDQTMSATVYHDGAPLSVVGFEIIDVREPSHIALVQTPADLRSVLHRLDTLLQKQQSPTLYMRRHVRIYDGNWLYLVRPSESRFWSRSQARSDADSALAELLHQAKVGQE